MYSVLDKDIIKREIVPYLPLAKRGFQATVPLEEIVNAVLYKLKTGVQWHQLPLKSLFDDDLLNLSEKCKNLFIYGVITINEYTYGRYTQIYR